MTSDLTSELKRAATSAFEQLGFFLPDHDLSEEQGGAPVVASCRVRFQGPVPGVMEVVTAGSFLEELAGNMLGDEDVPPRELILDALGEISNVICGNVLPSLGGRSAVFDLESPEVRMGEESTPPAGEKVAEVILGLDEGRAEISIHLDR